MKCTPASGSMPVTGGGRPTDMTPSRPATPKSWYLSSSCWASTASTSAPSMPATPRRSRGSCRRCCAYIPGSCCPGQRTLPQVGHRHRVCQGQRGPTQTGVPARLHPATQPDRTTVELPHEDARGQVFRASVEDEGGHRPPPPAVSRRDDGLSSDRAITPGDSARGRLGATRRKSGQKHVNRSILPQAGFQILFLIENHPASAQNCGWLRRFCGPGPKMSASFWIAPPAPRLFAWLPPYSHAGSTLRTCPPGVPPIARLCRRGDGRYRIIAFFGSVRAAPGHD